MVLRYPFISPKGRPIKFVRPYIWALSAWGGWGLNGCLDGLGHLFREELSKFNWAFPCFLGGSKRLRGWFEASIYGYNGVFNEFSEKLPKCRVHHRLWVFLKDEFTVHQYKPHSKDKWVSQNHFSLAGEGDIGIVGISTKFSNLSPQEGLPKAPQESVLHFCCFLSKPNDICNFKLQW